MVPLKFPSLSIDSTIRDAVRMIEQSRRGIATITDAHDRLLGTLTDGDIRRAILRGVVLESPASDAMNAAPLTASADSADTDLLALLHERGLEALPLLDEVGRLVSIAHIRDLLPESAAHGGAEGFVAAIVMAGGEGRRLRPLTDTIPKPMVDLGGMPLIERHVRRLERAGIGRVFIAVNYLGHVIEEHFARRPPERIAVDYLREDRKMGTAGALSLLPALPDGPILVLNADVVHSADYANLLAFHTSQGAALTVAAVEHHVQIPYGVIRMDQGRVRALEEKPSQSFLCNAGIYALGAAARQRFARNRPVDMTEVITELAADGEVVCAFPMHEYWADIANTDDLAKVRHEISKLDGAHAG
jgi:dTDP-glucose pyrophosphorylase